MKTKKAKQKKTDIADVRSVGRSDLVQPTGGKSRYLVGIQFNISLEEYYRLLKLIVTHNDVSGVIINYKIHLPDDANDGSKNRTTIY